MKLKFFHLEEFVLICYIVLGTITERRLVGHRQEVCGLKWSPDNQYLASGGNDNRLYVWNMQSLSPVQTYTDHLAAVKAIAWSPHHHGLLASGGGTADRCIRFWNTLTGQPMQCVDTGKIFQSPINYRVFFFVKKDHKKQKYNYFDDYMNRLNIF